jgi:hypothetical protein
MHIVTTMRALALLAVFALPLIASAQQVPDPDRLLAKYTTVRLSTDLGVLSENERRMIPLLIEAAEAMDEIFWIQAYGDRDALMRQITDPRLRAFAAINYGPWDRVAGNAPFVTGYGPKPEGANFYPSDAGREEVEAAGGQMLGEYTMVRRGPSGQLVAIPYHEYFAPQMQRAADRLREAAALAPQEDLKRYLELRADALLSGDYQPSDLAWMDMKDNVIEVVIGPIEHYEDQLFGAKAAAEAFILIKDLEWSERLSRYAELLPVLQRGLPVSEAYKQESPGSDSDLNAYDAIYYSGDANAGSKTIAINLPNDEEVQLQKGTRRLQLKNSMQAKFDEILVPIANLLIAEDQRHHITFEAFFNNVMFHEVAHGLGIKNTITGRGTVREALRDHYSALEEGKADVLGLFMITELQRLGEIDVDLSDHYVTFLAGIFRSVRFGAASAHGRANMVRFNYFAEKGAFSRIDESGTYRVHFDRMAEAVNSLSERILVLQGEGDYDAVADFVGIYGQMSDQLRAELLRVDAAGIPVDIVFEQGLSVLDF